jgi:anaphase-promoting complex subunit 2
MRHYEQTFERTSDAISTLVSIYDSKDLFVKELQVLLAQRLLAIKDDSMEKVEKEARWVCFCPHPDDF